MPGEPIGYCDKCRYPFFSQNEISKISFSKSGPLSFLDGGSKFKLCQKDYLAVFKLVESAIMGVEE